MVNQLSSAVAYGVVALSEVYSWAVWGVLAVIVLCVELVGVFGEKRTGFLPLTRVVRDRLMRKHKWAKLGVFFFISWLMIHFMFPEVGL